MKTGVFVVFVAGAGVLATACGPLIVAPGDDYRVAVTKPEVRLVQQIGTYDLDFTVNGCDDFVADISVNGGERNTLTTKPLGGGRFSTTLPVDIFRNTDSYCLYDSERPQKGHARLTVTCRQDQRSTSSDFQVTFAPAWRASYRGRGPVDAVFAGASADRFYALGSGWLDGVSLASDARPEVEATSSSSWAPLLVEHADRTIHLWSACPINDCGSFYFVDTPSEKVMTGAALLQVFEQDGDDLRFVRNVTVPPDGVDLVADGAASVLLSSSAQDSALTRIEGEKATVIALLRDEVAPSRFGVLDGRHVFLTRTRDGRTRLRRSDGTLVVEVPTPGTGTIDATSLAPTGDAWITIRGGQAWISTLDRTTLTATSTLLSSTLARLLGGAGDGRDLGAAWTTSGVVLRDTTGVELFERTAPFARRWSVVDATAIVTSAVGVGDSVVVLTRTGVRIYDSSGHPTGGADPVPQACAVDYRPEHLAVVGPDRVALAGRSVTYELKVGATTEVSK